MESRKTILMNLFEGQQWRHRHREQTYGQGQREDGNIYTTVCKIDSQWEFAVCLKEIKPGLCDNLEGWEGVGDEKEVQEGGTYKYLRLIHIAVLQKSTQYYKAVIPQLKINKCFKDFFKYKFLYLKTIDCFVF